MLVVKRFTAAWCGPCKALAPVVAEVAKENTDVQFETIDVDSNPSAAAYGITSIPTIIFEKDGQEVKRIVGLTSKSNLITLIKSLK